MTIAGSGGELGTPGALLPHDHADPLARPGQAHAPCRRRRGRPRTCPEPPRHARAAARPARRGVARGGAARSSRAAARAQRRHPPPASARRVAARHAETALAGAQGQSSCDAAPAGGAIPARAAHTGPWAPSTEAVPRRSPGRCEAASSPAFATACPCPRFARPAAADTNPAATTDPGAAGANPGAVTPSPRRRFGGVRPALGGTWRLIRAVPEERATGRRCPGPG
jgi:hypothetical protein